MSNQEHYACKTCKQVIHCTKANRYRKYGCIKCAQNAQRAQRDLIPFAIIKGNMVKYPVGIIGYNYKTKVLVWG